MSHCASSWWLSSGQKCGVTQRSVVSYLVTSVSTLILVVTLYVIIRCGCLYRRRRQLQRAERTPAFATREIHVERTDLPLNPAGLSSANSAEELSGVCVIMAGEEAPTFLAQPAPFTSVDIEALGQLQNGLSTECKEVSNKQLRTAGD